MKTIGITQTDSSKKNAFYANWIMGNGDPIEIVPLSYQEGNLKDLEKCDAIVLSGGVDVHPKYYHNSRLDYPQADVFNEPRDEFEIKVVQHALGKKIPLLAICRGMQLTNCILKGDLIQDLQEVSKDNHSQINSKDIEHTVYVEKNSLLHSIIGMDKGRINSAHHQALGKISDELMISAISSDDVIEAAEYKDKNGKPFLLCVQWHPERMDIPEFNIPFSKNIRDAFVDSIKK